MIYRIEYENGKCCIANGTKDLIDKLLKDETVTVTDIRKVYISGVTDSVLETYKKYLKK